MRLRTAVALAVVLLGLVGIVALAVGGTPTGRLTEQWVSDTVRDNRVNHHAVGVGPDGRVIVAPVAEVPNSDVPLTNTSCALVRLAPSNGSVIWRAGMPADDCFTHALTEPAIEDVDNDGAIEVVAATTQNAVIVREADSGRERHRIPLDAYGYGRPTVANIHPAPGLEILASDIGGTVVAAASNGTTLWRQPLGDLLQSRVSVWSRVLAVDVDADGDREVIVGSIGGLTVFTSDGVVEWTAADGAEYTAAGQTDDDPALEIAAMDGVGVRVVDGRTGTLEWNRTLGSIGRLRALGDGDGDGATEVYLGLADGRALALDARTGATEWSTTIARGDTPVLTAPVLADADGVGGPEVVVAARTGTVAVLDATTGAELAAYERAVPVWTFPTPADLDRDDETEILVRYGDGRVVALGYDA